MVKGAAPIGSGGGAAPPAPFKNLLGPARDARNGHAEDADRTLLTDARGDHDVWLLINAYLSCANNLLTQ
jgi:hypothetical protein